MRLFLCVFLLINSMTFAAEPSVKFCAAGDIMLSREVTDYMAKNGVTAPFTKIAPFLKQHDIAFGNLECPISTRGTLQEKRFQFRCHPDLAKGLMSSGFNTFSIANNHTYDWGPLALIDTRDYLRKNSFNFSGAGKDSAEAYQPCIIEKNGIKIALFSFTQDIFKYPHTSNDPQPAMPKRAQLANLIAKVKPSVDLVIVSYHWGTEYKHYPNSYQTKSGHELIDAGVDLVIGHHPHSIQSIEKYKGKWIVYSLGNGVFDQDFTSGTEAMIFSCLLKKSGVENPSFLPIKITNCQPSPATGSQFAAIATKFTTYCDSTGVSILRKGNLLVAQ